MTALFDLSGRVAAVTGARRGIDLAMAVALADAGADIIGVSAHLERSGSEVERRVRAAGRGFTALRADLADRAAVHRLAADPHRSQAILDRIPAGRCGHADDLAGATVFLASPASDYVNGIILPVDGGWLGR